MLSRLSLRSARVGISAPQAVLRCSSLGAMRAAGVHLAQQRRPFSAGDRLLAAPMVYISGEEMSFYMMKLVREQWIDPFIDTRQWEHYDLSCRARDDSEDAVLYDAIEAGKRLCCIFKEPTITPTMEQKQRLNLRQAWGSPNGVMRREWNGFTISRDTIHIKGVDLGFSRPVFFDRHAVGGEYGAEWSLVGQGKLNTTFIPAGKDATKIEQVCERDLTDNLNAVVTYHNPLDNVVDLAHHFFSRCLKARITPYVTSKKTVFKWQEGFWDKMKGTFDAHYKDKFVQEGLLESCGGELRHVLSDAATMCLMRWTGGGFGMAAHNYDGDMLTDELAQVHRSPGFITSNLIGRRDDGTKIQEFESSHGTVPDMWEAHLQGEETSMNPISMCEALVEAIIYSAELHSPPEYRNGLQSFAHTLRDTIHGAFASGYGTRDMAGSDGLTTEQFVEHVSRQLHGEPAPPPRGNQAIVSAADDVDVAAMRQMFHDLDTNGDGSIDFDEFSRGLARLGVQPSKYGFTE